MHLSELLDELGDLYELDGAVSQNRFAASRIIPYYARTMVSNPYTYDLGRTVNVPNVADRIAQLLGGDGDNPDDAAAIEDVTDDGIGGDFEGDEGIEEEPLSAQAAPELPLQDDTWNDDIYLPEAEAEDSDSDDDLDDTTVEDPNAPRRSSRLGGRHVRVHF